MANHVGVAALTLVRRTNGITQYVYAGEPYPADAAPGELDRHLEGGFIAVGEAEPVVVDPDAPERVVMIDGPNAPRAPRAKPA